MAHERFQTVEGQINWNDPMYKLYEKAKRNGGWNPADIDFSQDREDFLQLREEERIASLPLISSFSAGEEAVTLDILPMLHAMARQGRLEDTMFLTTFLHDEAKHTEMFSRWQQAVGVGDLDLSAYQTATSGFFTKRCPKQWSACIQTIRLKRSSVRRRFTI